MAIYAWSFENQKSFAKYYFEGVIKLFVQINTCITNFGFILTKKDMCQFYLQILTL